MLDVLGVVAVIVIALFWSGKVRLRSLPEGLRISWHGKKKTSQPQIIVGDLNVEKKTSCTHKWTRVESAFPHLLNEDMSDRPFVVAMWCQRCDLVVTVQEFEERGYGGKSLERSEVRGLRQTILSRRKGEVVGGNPPLFEDEVSHDYDQILAYWQGSQGLASDHGMVRPRMSPTPPRPPKPTDDEPIGHRWL